MFYGNIRRLTDESRRLLTPTARSTVKSYLPTCDLLITVTDSDVTTMFFLVNPEKSIEQAVMGLELEYVGIDLSAKLSFPRIQFIMTRLRGVV